MGSRTRLSAFATLEGSDRVTPAELDAFVAWVRAADAGEPAEPEGFPVDGAIAGMVDAAADLLASPSTSVHLAPGWQRKDPSTGTEWTVWELGILALDGDDPTGTYALALLVAPFAAYGHVATISREYFDDPTLVFSQGGRAFMARRGEVPHVVTDGDEVPWLVDHERPSADDYRRFGAAEGLAARAEADGEPLLARHLLGRTVLRALRDQDLGGDPEAARRGAQVALDVIAGGGDPSVILATPGWQLQEVDRFARSNGHGGRPSGRPIPRLGTVLDDAGSAPLDVGPHPLAVGEVVELLVPFPDADVPAGTRATVTASYDMGHAYARTDNGGSVTIRADDEGTSFRRA